jgi:peptidoglycan-associated lipoprotein
MNKKTMMVLIALAIACSALFLMTSCGGHRGDVTEETTTAPPTGPSEAELQAQREAAEARAEQERRAQEERMRAEAMARQEMVDFESINIYFDFDKSELTAQAMDVLAKKAAYLKKNPTYAVRIEGNCDERGTNEYNLALGDRRAHAAYDFLATQGVSKDRMSTISYGEERPLDSGSGEDAWAKNRNDQFVLVK